MRKQRSRNTGIELAIRQLLHAAGMRYRVHRRPLPNLRREADIVFSSVKVAVFVDGCFWHGCPDHGTQPKSNAEWWRAKIAKNQVRGRDTTERLGAAGWVCLRIWEHEPPSLAADRILETVKQRRQARQPRGVSAPS